MSEGGVGEIDAGVKATIPVALFAVMSYIMSSFLIHRYKRSTGKVPPLHETALTTAFGVIGGGAILLFTGRAVEFNNDLFFYLVLPPIIFSAGYNLKRKRFFRYSGFILLFGLLGTTLNFSMLAGAAMAYNTLTSGLVPSDYAYKLTWVEAFLLSSVLSASDEVSALSLIRMNQYPRLGAIIFGEGIINSALSIVLFKTFLDLFEAEKYSASGIAGMESHLSVGRVVLEVAEQMICSCFYGVTCGLICSRLFRICPDLRLYPIHQTSFVMLWAYLAYAFAEAFEYSGILSLFAASITLSHYAWHSLSKSSQLASRIAFVAVADMSEGFAFAYVGLSVWAYVYSPDSATNWLFTLYMLTAVLASRFITIPLLCNMMRALRCLSFLPCLRGMAHTHTLPAAEQRTFALGGLVRGCLCWAQVLQLVNIPGMQVMVSSTLLIVIITTVGCGICLPILIKLPSQAQPSTDASAAAAGGMMTPISVHSSSRAGQGQGQRQGLKTPMTESTLDIWRALGLRFGRNAPADEAEGGAGSSDDGSYTFGDEESSVNTDVLGGYSSFRGSLQNVPEEEEAETGLGPRAADATFAYSYSERAQVSRDRREMERRGVSDRLLSLPDVPKLLSTFDFLFRTRSRPGGGGTTRSRTERQGALAEGGHGLEASTDMNRDSDRDRDRDRPTIVTPSSGSQGAVKAGMGRGGGGGGNSDEESTYSTHMDITPLEDDTDRASQPSGSPLAVRPPSPQRINHIPPPTAEAPASAGPGPLQSRLHGQSQGHGQSYRDGRYGSFSSVVSSSSMGTFATNPYPTPPKRAAIGAPPHLSSSASARGATARASLAHVSAAGSLSQIDPPQGTTTGSGSGSGSGQHNPRHGGSRRGRSDAPFLYKLWVYVDTVYMKPVFGGSRADPGSASEEVKHRYITDVRSSFTLSPSSARAPLVGARPAFGTPSNEEREEGAVATDANVGHDVIWRRARPPMYVPIPDMDKDMEAGGLGLVPLTTTTSAASPVAIGAGAGAGAGAVQQHLGPEAEREAIEYMLEHSPEEQSLHPFVLSHSAPTFPSPEILPHSYHAMGIGTGRNNATPSNSLELRFREAGSSPEEEVSYFGDEKRDELEEEMIEPDDAHRLKDIVASPDGPFVIPEGEDFVFEEEDDTTPMTAYGMVEDTMNDAQKR